MANSSDHYYELIGNVFIINFTTVTNWILCNHFSLIFVRNQGLIRKTSQPRLMRFKYIAFIQVRLNQECLHEY